MRGVIQSRTGENGTCFRASLASILNLRESQVPDFPKANQDPGADKFLSQYGLRYEEFPITEDNAPVGYHFILGISPRGGEHAIVGKDGKPVWDPHPASDGTGQGLVEPERYGVLIPMKSKAKDARVDEDAAELARVYKAQGDAVARKLWAEKTKGLNYGQQVILQDKMSRLIKQSKVADTDPRAGVTKCQQCGAPLNGDDMAEVNGKVVCPDCADRRARLHRALDSTRADYERVASLQPTEVFQGNEYWQVGSDMYRNPVGNRGPIEPIGNTGKPGNARWECSVRDFPKMKKAYAIDSDPRFGVGEKVKYSGNVYKVITILPDAKYLIERIATGRRFKVSENSLSPYAGLPKLSAKDARRARLHRALDCVMDKVK